MPQPGGAGFVTRGTEMELDLTFFALAVPAVLLAGIAKGGFGSTAAFAAVPLLALALEPAAAVAVMLPLLLLMDFSALRPYWRQWEPRVSLILVLGGVPGAVLGAVLVGRADPDVFRFLIGAVALAFVSYRFGSDRGWIPAPKAPIPDRIGFLFGMGTGFTSFIAHAGGPVAAVYMLSMNLEKRRYQATTIIVFLASNLLKFALYSLLGFFTWRTVAAGLYLAPVAVLGTFLGVRLHGLLPERAYFAVVYVCLTLAGVKLVFDALA